MFCGKHSLVSYFLLKEVNKLKDLLSQEFVDYANNSMFEKPVCHLFLKSTFEKELR